jgi:hypothetical protein
MEPLRSLIGASDALRIRAPVASAVFSTRHLEQRPGSGVMVLKEAVVAV